MLDQIPDHERSRPPQEIRSDIRPERWNEDQETARDDARLAQRQNDARENSDRARVEIPRPRDQCRVETPEGRIPRQDHERWIAIDQTEEDRTVGGEQA